MKSLKQTRFRFASVVIIVVSILIITMCNPGGDPARWNESQYDNAVYAE